MAAQAGDESELREALLGIVVMPFLVLSGLGKRAGHGLASWSIGRRLGLWRQRRFGDLCKEAKRLTTSQGSTVTVVGSNLNATGSKEALLCEPEYLHSFHGAGKSRFWLCRTKQK